MRRAYTHPIYGEIPPDYEPPISEPVAECAQRIAADRLAHPHRTTGDDEADTRALFRYVRAAMGRRPPEEVNRDHPTMDDESITEGIVRALNGDERA